MTDSSVGGGGRFDLTFAGLPVTPVNPPINNFDF